MTEPNDFDPTWDPIAASLKRQYSPPSLGVVEERIAAEAARMDAPSARAVGPEQEASANEAPGEVRGRWVVTAASMAAAALVLLILRPWDLPQADPDAEGPPIGETKDPVEVVPPSMSARAGFELEGFLSRGDEMPDPHACGPLSPPEVCSTDAGYPHLPPGLSVKQLGECGGNSGTSCAEVELPADRALLVQLSTGDRVIVCIEQPWTDPKPTLPPDSRYKIFRRELGDYILYEVTPLDEPLAAPLVRL